MFSTIPGKKNLSRAPIISFNECFVEYTKFFLDFSISHLQNEDRNFDLGGRLDLSLTLCADVLTVGGF